MVCQLNAASAPQLTAADLAHNVQKFQETHCVNGSIAVAIGDEVIYKKSFGFSDLSSDQRCEHDTQFFIASVTKQFTAAALLHVLWGHESSIDALKEALQKSLAHYLPENDPLWGDSMPDWVHKVTLHHLLTHTSGIFNFTKASNFSDIQGNPISIIEVTNLFKDKPLDFEPGNKYDYCNSGYFLIGEVVRRLSGKSLSHYLTHHFFAPLGMKNSFMPETGSGKGMKDSGGFPKLARGYTCDLTPNSPMVEIDIYIHNILLNGAGAIVSTCDDLLIWNSSLHNNKLFPKEVTELMLAEHVQIDPTNPSLYYCYGIEKKKDEEGILFSHDGGLDGFQSTLACRPGDQLSFVALSNLNPYNPQIKTLLKKAYDKNKHLERQKEFRIEFDAAMEEMCPGFQKALQRYDLFRLKDILSTEKS